MSQRRARYGTQWEIARSVCRPRAYIRIRYGVRVTAAIAVETLTFYPRRVRAYVRVHPSQPLEQHPGVSLAVVLPERARCAIQHLCICAEDEKKTPIR